MSEPWLWPIDPSGWSTLDPEVRARLEAELAAREAARDRATARAHRTGWRGVPRPEGGAA